MLYVQIGKALSERLGCDEWLEFDYRRLNPIEAAVIQQRTGMAPPAMLRGLADGVQLRDQSGQLLLDDEGKPRVGRDWLAWTAVAWVAVRRAGCAASWDDVESGLNTLEFDWRVQDDDDAPADPDETELDAGKDESIPPSTSPPTSSGTSPRSRGSSASARGRSKS